MLKPEGDDEQLLVATSCKSCTDVIAMRNPRKCDKCGWYYDLKCMPIQAIREGGKTIQVCKNCLVAANKTPSSTSTSSPSSRSGSPLSQQQTRCSKPASAPPSRSSSSSRKEDPVLNKILNKLNKLDNIEKQQNEMKNQLSESKSALEKRMTAIEKSLEPLKEIPALINRVTVMEGEVAALRAEQEEIKAKLEQLLINGAGSSSSPSNTPALCTETIQQLREANTRIQAQLDSVTSSQA
ncbi:hypothetical protein TSAR_010948 [Trichomalopsis sarcophagae]|uniref:PHD-type domain-containing protein n=1 Tax=Trichomalopsis sarcophagae TaxID=543379 RepID=A0A232FE13_9HYME|nr:hypothetical protein TSAR_010948 [Trichomalopsis sarcophagae]